MLTQNQKRLLAVTLKSLKLGGVSLLRLALVYDVHKVVGQNEGHSFASESELLLEVPQNVTEIYVKQLSGLLDHYIVRVSVGYSENIRGDAVTRAAQSELLDGLVQRRFRVIVVLQPSQ